MNKKFKGAFTNLRKYRKYSKFKQEFNELKKQDTNRFRFQWDDIHPLLGDKGKMGFDAHYFYHLCWAARQLKKINPAKHVDVSSHYFWAGIVSSIVPTDYYEFNTIDVKGLDGYSTAFADLYQLPFEDKSIASLSCMHVVEHVGLGRYGDRLDYDGDLKAINELKRVMALNGDILFVVPIAEEPAIVFNAHRVYSYEQIISFFKGFELKEFALIPEKTKDDGIIINPDQALLKGETYACGCFHFVNNQ